MSAEGHVHIGDDHGAGAAVLDAERMVGRDLVAARTQRRQRMQRL